MWMTKRRISSAVNTKEMEHQRETMKILNDSCSSSHFFDSLPSIDSPSIIPGTYYPKNRAQRKHRNRQNRQQNERAITKTGDFNLDIPYTRHKGFFSNWFMTMVDARWRWTSLNFFLTYTGEWLFFGSIYWLISYAHSDLEIENLPNKQNVSNWTPCIENIHGFTSTFLFSIEVDTTLAYGHRSITLQCPSAITTMCLQCILSSIFQAFMIGILFAKLTRPKARTQTILFSKDSVICLRDGKFCFILRVGDIRKSRILNVNCLLYLIKTNAHNEIIEQTQLETFMDGCESQFFLMPLSVIHEIDESSPLYGISAADLLDGRFEFIAIFEGVIESTGQPVQARTSYTEAEVLWGHRFVNLASFNKQQSYFEVNFSRLGETEQIDSPLCSASEFDYVVDAIKCSSKEVL